MAQITAKLVKELREKTGAGMMDCKKALTETGGDFEAAVDWLRTKGLSKAAKKSSRVAADGLVGTAAGENMGAVIEVNAETDFVARNEQFQQFVRDLAQIALNVGDDVEAIKKAPYPGKDRDVEAEITDLIATIGENMTLRRARKLTVREGHVASYIHSATASGLGKIGVLVAVEGDADAGLLESLGKNIAMHVAASAPLALDETGIDADMIAREKEVFAQQARESGKPENIIEKMVEGRIRKFVEESALLKQKFVLEPDQTVEAVIKKAGKEAGVTITLKAFERFALGEGIEKETQDFAAEVAAATKG